MSRDQILKLDWIVFPIFFFRQLSRKDMLHLIVIDFLSIKISLSGELRKVYSRMRDKWIPAEGKEIDLQQKDRVFEISVWHFQLSGNHVCKLFGECDQYYVIAWKRRDWLIHIIIYSNQDYWWICEILNL